MAVELSEREKELLSALYTTELQRKCIESGELYDFQLTTLEQLRALERWLGEKYPSHVFTVVSIEPKVALKTTIDYGFTADGGDTVYYASAPEEGSTAFREGFYASLFREDCAALLLGQLRDLGLPVTALELSFLGLAGDGVTERTTPRELLELGAQVSRRVTVFLGTDGAGLEQARRALEDLGQVSAYWLFAAEGFREGMDAEACWAYKRGHGDAVSTASFVTEAAELGAEHGTDD